MNIQKKILLARVQQAKQNPAAIANTTITLVENGTVKLEDWFSDYKKGKQTPVTIDQLKADLSHLDHDGLIKLTKEWLDTTEKLLTLKPRHSPIDPTYALLSAVMPRTAVNLHDRSDLNELDQTRLQDKIMTNAIGALNETMCEAIPNCKKSTSGRLDIVVAHQDGTCTYGEFKNKHNTMNAAGRYRLWQTMDGIAYNKLGSTGATNLVVKIRSNNERFKGHFTPSDPNTGRKPQAQDRILEISAAHFFAEHTGDEYALHKVHIFLAMLYTTLGVFDPNDDISPMLSDLIEVLG